MPSRDPGDLEVHVAVVVFLAGDVRQDREAVAVGDEAHGDAGHGRLDRHARVHEGEGSAADRRHGRGAVGLEDVGHDAYGVGEDVVARQHGGERPAREVAVTDVAAGWAAHELRLADGEGREVVVEEERVLALALVLLDDLRVVGGAEGRGHEGLGLAPGEEGRAVGAGEDADLGGDRADLRELAPVEALAGEDRLARQDLDEVVSGLGHLLALVGLGLGHHRNGGLLDRLDLGVGGDLVRQRHRGHHRRLPGPADFGEDARRVRLGSLPEGLLEPAAALEGDLGADDLPDGLVAEEDRVDQGLLGDLAGAAFDHDDGVVRAAHDQVEVRLVALGVGGVEDELAVETPDADRADGRVERDGRAGQGHGGPVDREDVGVVLAVGGEDESDDLGLVVEALRKQRPHGPVDQSRGQDLFLRRPSFTLEPAAGDPARGVGRLPVVDGQGKELGVLLRLLVEDGRGEHDRVAEADHGGAVRLLGEFADLDVEGFGPEGDGDLVDHSGALFSKRRRSSAVFCGAFRGEVRCDGVRPPAARRPWFRRRDELLPEAETLDQLVVATGILFPEILEQPTPAPDHLEQAAAGVVILGVRLKVLGQVRDPRREKRDLNLRGPGVGAVSPILFDDVGLGRLEFRDVHSASK